MRVTFVISSLGGGGMERVACTMANRWVAAGWSVTILTFDGGVPFYELDGRVRHVPLGIAGVSPNPIAALGNNLKRLGALRRAIRDSGPDVVLGFMDTTNVLTLLATRGLGVPVVASEHQDPFLYRIGGAWERLRRLTYGWADRVVVNSESIRAYFPPRIRARSVVLPSPVILEGWREDAPEKPLPRPLVLAVGRLTTQKGLDLLLGAFARLRERFPEWTLVVLGEGPLRAELERLRDQLGLAGRVHFPGTVPNPRAVLAQADLFVMPSRWESFPMALCEAMASGLPVITTEYHPGVHDIVRDGVDALVVPREDVNALAAAMDRLMADGAERRRLASRSAEITERYGPDRVMAMWGDVLGQAARGGTGVTGSRLKALIPCREALGEVREGWRRCRYRQTLERRELVIPPEGIHLSYGEMHPRGAEELVQGGRVKLLHLQEAFPTADRGFNILYLVSSARPRFGPELARWARGRGAKVVWNQDGVAYPAWAGRSYRRLNARAGAGLRSADYIIYQSEFCRESAGRYLGRAAAPWEILYNCVDTEAFHPAGAPPPRPWTLLAAGTHQQRGRVLSALETVAILKRRGEDVRLVLAGVLEWPGADADVGDAIRQLGIASAVELAGPYTQKEAPGLFRRAHVLLHPKYKDPSPTVPLEAMASGVPVVASGSGGMPELVGEHGGILVAVPESWEQMHVPDPEAMAAAVREIMADWSTWSRQARGRAEGQFRKDAWVERHRAIFHRLLGHG